MFASIKHDSLTKYAALHQQGPPLRASSTQQTVCPAIALQCSLKREMNNSGYVLQADLPLNKTAIICQAALGKEVIPHGDEYGDKMFLLIKLM